MLAKKIANQYIEFGDSSLLNNTLYCNYNNQEVTYPDMNMENTAEFLDMLSFSDTIDAYTYRTMNFEL